MPDEAARSGEHEMTIKINGKEICKNKVWINKSTAAINIGLSGFTTSEKAVAALVKNQAKITGITLKKGDGQRPEDFKWRLNGKSGSLPLITHTKGPGGRNEKAALAELVKVLKAEG